jgi:hypothetical protein
MNPYELADELKQCIDDGFTDLVCVCDAANMLRQQADRIERKRELIREQTALLVKQNNRIAELEKSQMAWYEAGKFVTPQIKKLSDEENNLKWWISSFEHLKALGGGINDEMEAKLKEMKEKLKKANEK